MQQVIYQILILFLLGLTGYIAGRTGYLPKSSGTILSAIVIKLTAPFLIFTTLAKSTFTHEIISNGLWISFFTLIFLIFSFATSVIAGRLMRLPDTTKSIYSIMSMFGNVIFLAFPLIKVIYGDIGILYAIFYTIANDSLLWTLGIYLINRHKTKHWKENLKHLINGNTIAFLSGLIFMILGMQNFMNSYEWTRQIYNIFMDAFVPLGHTTIYLSMVFIGLILSEIRINSFGELIRRYPLIIMSITKLIIVPLIALSVMKIFGSWLNPMVISIVILELAMPSGTITSALAAQYDSDYKFTAEGILFTTLFSIITLPIIYATIQ